MQGSIRAGQAELQTDFGPEDYFNGTAARSVGRDPFHQGGRRSRSQRHQTQAVPVVGGSGVAERYSAKQGERSIQGEAS